PGVANDPMALDQREDEIRRPLGERGEGWPALRTEFRRERVGGVFRSGNDLAAVASRGAPAGLARLDQHRLDSSLREMQRSRKAGEAAADDRDLGPCLALERRRWRRRLG